MKDLSQQFDDLLKAEFGNIQNQLNARIRRLGAEGLRIFKGFVPIDTRNLQKALKMQITETKEGFEIIIFVENKELETGINSIKLGLILERGRGKGGVRLKRTKQNIYAGLRTPTEAWFQDASKAWYGLADQILEA